MVYVVMDGYFVSLVIHNNINHSSGKFQTVIADKIVTHNNINHSSGKLQTVIADKIVICLKFTRRVVYIVMDDYFVSYYCLKFARRVVYCCGNGWLFCQL
jgi:hypothetical protein